MQSAFYVSALHILVSPVSKSANNIQDLMVSYHHSRILGEPRDFGISFKREM